MPCLIVALEEAYSILFVVRSDAAFPVRALLHPLTSTRERVERSG